MHYTGYQYLSLTDKELAEFYETKDFDEEIVMYENEYLLIENNGEIVDKYCFQNDKLRKVKYSCFKTPSLDGYDYLKPRNIEQELAFDMLNDNKSTVKLITGTWGSGKSIALCRAAMDSINNGRFKKIVWIRNNVQVKDTDNLGALPGSEIDKILPYVMPLADHVGGVGKITEMIKTGVLEVIPLGFLRGRSIRNSVIISTEAENLTREHLQLLLGRVDEGSNLWLDADLRQRDRVVFEKSAGIETLIDRLKGQELFGYVHLIKTERSKTAQMADLLND